MKLQSDSKAAPAGRCPGHHNTQTRRAGGNACCRCTKTGARLAARAIHAPDQAGSRGRQWVRTWRGGGEGVRVIRFCDFWNLSGGNVASGRWPARAGACDASQAEWVCEKRGGGRERRAMDACFGAMPSMDGPTRLKRVRACGASAVIAGTLSRFHEHAKCLGKTQPVSAGFVITYPSGSRRLSKKLLFLGFAGCGGTRVCVDDMATRSGLQCTRGASRAFCIIYSVFQRRETLGFVVFVVNLNQRSRSRVRSANSVQQWEMDQVLTQLIYAVYNRNNVVW